MSFPILHNRVHQKRLMPCVVVRTRRKKKNKIKTIMCNTSATCQDEVVYILTYPLPY